MTLYLIAHKVRGEPAFDIAERTECAICHGVGSAGLRPEDAYEGSPCSECDGLGYWWIIPTSGHRAHPWWSVELQNIDDRYNLTFDTDMCVLYGAVFQPQPMPADLPDHYAANDRNLTLPITDSVRARLGLGGPVHKVVRRL